MKRKLVAIFTAILLTASLVACGNGGNEETTTSGDKININVEDPSGTKDKQDTEETEETEETTETETKVKDPDEVLDPGEYTYTLLETPETIRVLSATGAATLRTADYEMITTLPNDTVLERTGISNGANGFWSQVVYEGETCYIATHLITTLVDLDEGFVEVTKTLVKADGSLKIRIAPDMNSEVVGYISAGQEITVVAENKTTGWYKIEFIPYGMTETSTGYIASNPDYYEPEIDITVPDGSAAYIDGIVAFVYPESWVEIPGDLPMIMDEATGSTINLVYENYTEDHALFFTLNDEMFAEIFIPMYTEMGYAISDYSVKQETKGDAKVAIMSFTNTVGDLTMYQTQYVFTVASNQICTLTVTETSAETTVAEDVYASLIIAE